MPAFGQVALVGITSAMVRTWYAKLDKSTPTMRAHTYSLLRTITRAEASDGLITASPCRVPGAGKVTRKVTMGPATLGELEVIAAAMPAWLRMIVLLAAWLGLRFGELAELRRADVDLVRGVIKVRRGVVRVKGERVVYTPKSAAGVRWVSIPAHLIEPLRSHLAEHVAGSPRPLLFPSFTGRADHVSPDSRYEPYYTARGGLRAA